MPTRLDLVGNYEETAEFIERIRDVALRDRKPICLVFDKVKHISSTALLLLLAQIHQCRLLRGSSGITGTYPNDPQLERVMHDTGFFNLLDVKSRVKPKALAPGSVEYIRFMSDARLAQHNVIKLRESLLGDELSMDILSRKKLYRALSEAMTNVSQHAYPAELAITPSVRGRWWLAGSVDKKKDELTIMFCDLGVGISNTLPKQYPMETIAQALSLLPGINPNDGEMIQAAMVLGRSQTGNRYRGKGLHDLKGFIDQSKSGQLRIYSQHGAYGYIAGGAERVNNGNTPVFGTLIHWRVPLSAVTSLLEDVEGDADE